MAALIVILSILLIIALVLLIRVKIVIEYSDEEVNLYLRILGIKITIIPKKEKPIRLSDYSPKALKKKKKIKKEKQKKAKKKLLTGTSGKDAPFSEKLSFIIDLVKYLTKKFFGHLRVDLTRVIVVVGSDDAAKTAVMYGVINQACAILLDILDRITNVKKGHPKNLSVSADFTKEKIEADIKIAFSIQIWQTLSIAFGALSKIASSTMKKIYK